MKPDLDDSHSAVFIKMWPFILASTLPLTSWHPPGRSVWRCTLIMTYECKLKQSSVVTRMLLWNIFVLNSYWLQSLSCVKPPNITRTKADIITSFSRVNQHPVFLFSQLTDRPTGLMLASLLSTKEKLCVAEQERKGTMASLSNLLSLCLWNFHLICL